MFWSDICKCNLRTISSTYIFSVSLRKTDRIQDDPRLFDENVHDVIERFVWPIAKIAMQKRTVKLYVKSVILFIQR